MSIHRRRQVIQVYVAALLIQSSEAKNISKTAS